MCSTAAMTEATVCFSPKCKTNCIVRGICSGLFSVELPFSKNNECLLDAMPLNVYNSAKDNEEEK